MKSNYKKLGDCIREVNIKNKDLEIRNLLGVNIDKCFMPSIANTVDTDMSKYKIVNTNQFVYKPFTSRNGDKISIALLQDNTSIVSQAYTVFEIVNHEELDPEYLMMWFSRPEFNRYARYKSHGTVHEIFNWEEMCDIELPIHSIEKQREIVAQYKTIVNHIQLNEKINKTLEEIAQAIFKSWFVDFDPVHAKVNALKNGGSENDACIAAMCAISGKTTEALEQLKSDSQEEYTELKNIANAFPSSFIDSKLGPIPYGWEVKGLDQIANYLNGLALQKFRPKDQDHFLPVLKIAQLKKGATNGAEKASPDIKPEYIIDNGDIIFSWSGSLFVDIWCGGKAALNQHLFNVTSTTYPKWLYYLCTCHHIKEFNQIAAAKAVTMGHIKREHLAMALCAIPSTNDNLIEICNNIIGQNLYNQIKLRLNCTTLTKLRDTLLPKLLYGINRNA